MKMKSIKSMLVLSVIMSLAFISYGQGSVAKKLSDKDKVVSNQFKSLSGQDRVAVFQQLQHLIVLKQSNNPNPVIKSDFMGNNVTTIDDLILLLGNPTQKVGNTWYYSLKSNSNSCRLLVGMDKDGNVIFSTIKNCN